VVYGRSCLALVATCSHIDDTAIISCGLLVALFAPLLASPSTHLSALDGDAGRHFPAATWGWSKLGCHGAGGVMGGNTMPFFGGALASIGQCVERSQLCSVMHTTFVCPYQRSLGVTARPPLSTGLIMVWVPHVLLGLQAYLGVLPACHGLAMWALLPQRNFGGEVGRQWWSHPHHGWCPVGPLPAGSSTSQARSGVRVAPVGALH
jgi:hypothetical protein